MLNQDKKKKQNICIFYFVWEKKIINFNNATISNKIVFLLQSNKN